MVEYAAFGVAEPVFIALYRRRQFAGPPGAKVDDGLLHRAEQQARILVCLRSGADEFMITSQIFDHAARLRSFEIVAQAAGLKAQ